MIERRRLMQNPGIEWDEYGRAIIDGYEVVDLGPDFDFVIATCNVGAEHEYDYGNYYAYGSGSQVYDQNNPMYIGTENPLNLSNDTARQVMGENWRMPTQAELKELIANTNYTWTTINDVEGGKCTSKTDSSKYVFFPASGSYKDDSVTYAGSSGSVLSSTPYDSYTSYTLFFGFNTRRVDNYSRSFGYSVRGVISKSDISSYQSQLPYTDTVSYLQSSGTQYINTGINGGPNIKIVIDGAFLSSTNSFHGAENSTRKIVIGVYNSKFYLIHGQAGGSVADVDTSRHTFSVERGTVTFDGTSYSITAYSGTTKSGEIYLFADNIQGTVSSYTSFKLYSAKIYSGGTLVRDFIPVRVGQTGCLYDSVSGTLFKNQGSGSFSFG